VTEIALSVLERVIGEKFAGKPKPEQVEEPKSDAAALSKLGASKGGMARAKKLTAMKRSEIARRAAKTR